jgi:hypothetical protein
MLLALASAVFLGSESLGTSDHILLSQISDFSSPATTRKIKVEVFDFRGALVILGNLIRCGTDYTGNSLSIVEVCLPSCPIATVEARTP